MQDATAEILSSSGSPEFDTFLKGMIRAFEEVLQAKPALLDDVFQEEETDEIPSRDVGN
jgi:hypothetical protein